MMQVACSVCGKFGCIQHTQIIPQGVWQTNERGWVCPVCGAGNAPTTPQCFCKNKQSGVPVTDE